MHVELYLQDLIKDAQEEKFALHSIKSDRASSDLALRKVDIETCWLKELQDQAKICEINSKSYFKGR